jgi:Fe-S cluster biogenesis protein NfuA
MRDHNDRQFQDNLARIEQLIIDSEQAADPLIREKTKDLLQTLLDLHSAGLARLIEIVSRAGEPGQAIVQGFTHDELVKPLLLLYGLHPLPVEERVKQALDKITPSLGVHGVTAEVLSIETDRVTLDVHHNGNGNAHGSFATTVKQALEEALCEAAPELTEVQILGFEQEMDLTGASFIPLDQVKSVKRELPVSG